MTFIDDNQNNTKYNYDGLNSSRIGISYMRYHSSNNRERYNKDAETIGDWMLYKHICT